MRRPLLGVLVGLGVLAACGPRTTRPDEKEQARAEKPSGAKGYLEEGLASFYGPGLEGRPTASGEKLDLEALTAAHRKLPFGTCLRVVNMENGRSVRVRVNDRGPFVAGRVVDVSLAAAKQLGMVDKGVVRVRLYRCSDRTSSFGVPSGSRAG